MEIKKNTKRKYDSKSKPFSAPVIDIDYFDTILTVHTTQILRLEEIINYKSTNSAMINGQPTTLISTDYPFCVLLHSHMRRGRV